MGQKVKLQVGSSISMYPKWAFFLARHPGSWSTLTKCPTQSIYNDGSWAYRFKASAGSKSKTVLLSGSGDPGYRFTALGLAEAGLCLAGKTGGCLKPASVGGVFTSMSAMDSDVLQHRLEHVGLLKSEMILEETAEV